jgi:Uma2 family endonuclease
MTATVTTNWIELIELLPADSQLVLHNKDWDDYEALLEQIGEASGLRISYSDGTLQIMTLSSEHENYVRFFESLITAIRLRLRLNIRSFGSMTMRRRKQNKGNEPDACFYVQNAALLGNKMELILHLTRRLTLPLKLMCITAPSQSFQFTLCSVFLKSGTSTDKL